MKARVLAAAGLLAAAAYFVGLALDAPALRLVVKPVPALVLAAWVLTGPTKRTCYARFIALGLVLSAVGDVLLEGPAGFVAGLGAFLLAHLAYVAAFVGETRRPALLRAVPFAAYAWPMLGLMRPGLGALAAPVTVYVAALTAMQWRAAACVGASSRGRRAEWTALAGAVLFALSDSLIGLDRFHAPIAHVRWAIMLLYWLGQTGLALSVRPSRGRTRGASPLPA